MKANRLLCVGLIMLCTVVGCSGPPADTDQKASKGVPDASNGRASSETTGSNLIAPAFKLAMEPSAGPIAFSSDGEWLAAGDVRTYGLGSSPAAPFRGKLTLWKFRDGTKTEIPMLDDTETTSLAFAKDPNLVVAVNVQGYAAGKQPTVTLRVIDVAKQAAVVEHPLESAYYQWVVSPDGSMLMSGRKNGSVVFFDVESLAERAVSPPTGLGQNGQVSMPVMSSDWSILGVYNQATRAVDFIQFPEITPLGSVPSESIGLYWLCSPDRRTAYVSNRDKNSIDVWDFVDPPLKGKLLRVIDGVQGLGTALSPDGTILVINGDEMIAVPEGNFLGKLAVNSIEEFTFRFSSDSKLFARRIGQQISVWERPQFSN